MQTRNVCFGADVDHVAPNVRFGPSCHRRRRAFLQRRRSYAGSATARSRQSVDQVKAGMLTLLIDSIWNAFGLVHLDPSSARERTASARVRADSFKNIRLRCVLIVSGATPSWIAMALFDCPAAISETMAVSRCVSRRCSRANSSRTQVKEHVSCSTLLHALTKEDDLKITRWPAKP